MSRRSRLLVRLWPWVLTLLVLAPVLPPGFVLSYDMVFVPDLALRPDFLGLGTGLPRAVPSDALVAVIDGILPGMAVQKGVLALALVAAGTGARRLAPAEDPVAQLVATTVYLWSPLVAERLVIGHWPLLLTYAVLPWIVDTARRARTGETGLGPLVLLIAAGSLSAAGGVLATLFATIFLVGRSRTALRRTVTVALAGVAVNATWVVAGLLQAEAAVSDPAGVEVFAARGEGGLPVWLTVLTLGGIWNSDAVPASRTGWPVTASLLLLLALCLLGARRLRSARASGGPGGADVPRLASAGALGILLALGGALAPSVLVWVVATVPGGGLLRDGSRALVLLAPLVAYLAAHGARAVVDLLVDRTARTLVATVLVLAPIALMPDLAWGVAGRLEPVAFPREYDVARTALADRAASSEGSPDVLILPFSSYRAPSWNDGRRTLDPLGRYLTPDYLTDDTLVVSGRTIAGEDPRARRVADLLVSVEEQGTVAGLQGRAAGQLAESLLGEGIGWVALDLEAEAALDGAAPSIRLPEEWLVHRGSRIMIWELPQSDGDAAQVDDGELDPGRDELAAVLLAAAWLTSAGVVVYAAANTVRDRRRRRRTGTDLECR